MLPKQIVMFDIPMCMAHRGLGALMREAHPGVNFCMFVNSRRTAAKIMMNDEVIVHIRVAEPMDADRLISLARVAGKLDESVQRKIRLEYAKRHKTPGKRKAA